MCDIFYILFLDETSDVQDDSSELVEDMVEQVLGLREPDLELPADDQVLVSQAGHLLEEPDITNVLNTIQPDEFNDFFTGNKIRIFLCAFLVCIGSQCNLTILIN